VAETHPVQYHAPVYRAVAELGVPLVAVYGSDFSVAGYQDREFGTPIAWDTDLLGGYESQFLARVSGGGPSASSAVSADGMDRVIAEVRPAAVLILGYSSRFDRGAIRAARRAKVPILFRGETTDHAVERSRLKGWVRDRLLAALYRRCGRLLYVGRRSREHYERLGVPADKLVFSPYCVSTEAFRTSEADRVSCRERVRTEMGMGSDQVLVLYSGKLVPRKGVDLLPAAVRGLPDGTARRVVLGFLGDGELRDELERRAAAPPHVSVRFFGFQNQTRLSDFYHAADLLVLPSRQGETWGLVVNEALHHGLPCVVSEAVGCTLDLVTDGLTGERFRPDDTAALTAALGRAVGLVGRADVRDQCRERVARYSVHSAAAGIVLAMESANG
jgi:glycosyltransferase involved in cell wall biosynthesis